MKKIKPIYIILIIILVIVMMNISKKQGISGSCQQGSCSDSFTEDIIVKARGINEDIVFNCDGSYSLSKYTSGTSNTVKTTEGLKVSNGVGSCSSCTSGASSTAKCELDITSYKTIISKAKLEIGFYKDLQATHSISSRITGYSLSTSCPYGFSTGSSQYPCPEHKSYFNGWVKLQKTPSGGFDSFYKECETCEWKYKDTLNIDKFTVSTSISVSQNAGGNPYAELEWIELVKESLSISCSDSKQNAISKIVAWASSPTTDNKMSALSAIGLWAANC